MPFDSTLPRNNTPADAGEMRNQLNGLKDLIDAVPAPTVPGFTAVLQVSSNAGGNTVTNLAALNFSAGLVISAVSSVMRFDSNLPVIIHAEHGPSIGINSAGLDVNGAPVLTAQSVPPVVAGDWAGSPPATLTDWFLRIAAAQSQNGANPIP